MSDDIFTKEWLLSFPPEKRKEKSLELKRKRNEFLAALANAPRITNNEEEETIMTDATEETYIHDVINALNKEGGLRDEYRLEVELSSFDVDYRHTNFDDPDDVASFIDQLVHVAYEKEAMAEAYTMEFYDFLTNAGAVCEKSFDRWHGSGNIWGYTLCLDFFNVDWDKLDLTGAIEEYNQIDEKDGCVKSEFYDLEDPDEYDNSIRAIVRLFERA